MIDFTKIKLSLLIACCILLASCNQNRPSGSTDLPLGLSESEYAADVAPTPTTISMATSTQSRPVATVTSIPTVTRLVPPSATPDLRVILDSIDDFGVSRNPLTGELMDDDSVLQRRPIAVKISNAPAKYVRPQSGLNQADLVFEHITEGSITRFTAVIYGETPAKIGPIRSARLIDLEIPVMYDAALVYSGSSIGVARSLFNSDFSARILRSNSSGYYRTGENKPYEHTLYAEPDKLWSDLEERGQNRAPSFWSRMNFSSESPPASFSATSVNIKYRKFTDIDWVYDPETNQYFRWIDGVEHRDANSSEQITATNVVLLLVAHQLNRSICENQRDGQCLAYSMEIQLWGQGRAYLLRDGQVYEVFWVRHTPGEMVNLADNQGTKVPLQIGNTWFQVIPDDELDSFSFQE
jgi:hypothetical protein